MKAPQGHKIRWWAEQVAVSKLALNWPVIGEFLDKCDNENVAAQSIRSMNELYLGPQRDTLMIQMCLVSDIGTEFVKVTTYLEGNYYCAPKVYDKLELLSTWLEIRCLQASKPSQQDFITLLGLLPSVRAATEYANNPEDWMNQRKIIRDFLKDLYIYYQERFDLETGTLKEIINIFKVLRIFDVLRVTERNMGPLDVEKLCELVLFKDYKVQLLSELPAYLVKCRNLSESFMDDDSHFDILGWFKICGLTAFKECAKLSALFVPSSASVERVFSMYERMFDDDQNSALKDYRTAAIMLRFNDLQRNPKK
jgi:hypothetical protein